jgi:hypothetical protein
VVRDHNRVAMPDERIAAYAGGRQLRSDILIGYWDEAERGSKQVERKDPRFACSRLRDPGIRS